MADDNLQEKGSKKSVFEVLSSAINTWFSMLMGRPVRKIPESVKQEPKVEPAQIEEDSVKEDFKKARGMIQKVALEILSRTAPSAEKRKMLGQKGLSYAKNVVDVSFTRKVVNLFMVVFFGLIIFFVVVRLNKYLGNSKDQGTFVPSKAPTVPPFQRTEPSLYADDAEILKIEEDAKVLLNEIIEKSLEDSSISTPQLDENIDFLK
jgi:hypothetical protein